MMEKQVPLRTALDGADPAPPPVVVKDTSPAEAQIASAIRIVTMLVGAIVAIFGFVAERDLAGLIAYIQTTEFLGAAGAALTFGIFIWSQMITRLKQRERLTIASRADDDVAVLVTNKETKP